MAAWLAADDVETARRHIRESMAQWSKTRFLVQHWQCMLWEAEIDLYAGEGARAWDRLARDARPLRRSHLLSVQLMRAFTHFIRGRSALASLDALDDAERAGGSARRRARSERSTRRRCPGRTCSRASWRRASRRPGGRRRRRARAPPGDRAREDQRRWPCTPRPRAISSDASSAEKPADAMVLEATEAMKTLGVRVPSRYAAMLVPGSLALTVRRAWPSRPERRPSGRRLTYEKSETQGGGEKEPRIFRLLSSSPPVLSLLFVTHNCAW